MGDVGQQKYRATASPSSGGPQAFISSYATRLQTYNNALIAPVLPNSSLTTVSRTKRGTIAINYAEDGLDDDDFEDSDRPRRTGLRSLRHQESQDRDFTEKLAQDSNAPVDVQGIWRDWMAKPRTSRADKQVHAQTQLPVTLIPIRIDVDVPSHTPDRPMPLPPNYQEFGINPQNPAYRIPDTLPPYRIKDVFLWNLHECLITPEEFALVFVRDLDLPSQQLLATQIAEQIRSQLEQYAGVALHPLFQHSIQAKTTVGTSLAPVRVPGFSRADSAIIAETRPHSHSHSRARTRTPSMSRPETPAPFMVPLPIPISLQSAEQPQIEATATAATNSPSDDLNPDDAYRCVINLSINLSSKLYTDKFEWSLLHPPDYAANFSVITCSELGLPREWVPVMTHAIYEAVLRLKKEACETGMMGIPGAWSYGAEVENAAADPRKEAGWRYDEEGLCEEWSPTIEVLSREEIEKREGDRERQIRRLRRETARFSSSANIPNLWNETNNIINGYGEVLGERSSRKRRRLRSNSPSIRDTTPLRGRGATPEGYGGNGPALADWERPNWRCEWCKTWGMDVWAVRDGPDGPRTLCNNCGLIYERDGKLPVWMNGLHKNAAPLMAKVQMHM